MQHPGSLVSLLVLVLATSACAPVFSSGPGDGPTPPVPSPARSTVAAEAEVTPVPSGAVQTEVTTVPSGATGAESTPAPSGAIIREVPPTQWQDMIDAGMIRPECPIQSRSQLRRVELDHVDFDGVTRRGHLVVNQDVAASVARVFERLFEEGFPIEQMTGVEEYGGDVNRSLAANNTSAFNCRRSDQIHAPFAASPHANGRAVDINPVQNPWINPRCDCWIPGPEHQSRDSGAGKVAEGGLVWQLFTDEGWIWQNIDTPDYMHFDTGYPSAPYSSPTP